MELVTFETAKLAKEKGFSESQFNGYNDQGKLKSTIGDYDWIKFSSSGEGFYVAPTQSQLQKWLREEHGIYVSVPVYQPEAPGTFFLIAHINTSRGSEYVREKCIRKFNGIQTSNTWQGSSETFCADVKGDYEKALEVGLLEALKLIKI